MRKICYGVTAGFLAAALVSSGALAQQLEGVVVEASRVATTTIGHSNIGAPINSISLSYRVKYSDLDLGTSAGAAALEKRVNDAARDACAEIGRLYPEAQPSDAECTRITAKQAMVKVHEVVAKAGKAPPK